MEPLKDENYEDIQGLVFSGYGKRMSCVRYHLLRIGEPGKARTWLQKMMEESRVTHGRHRGTTWCLNIAFTSCGLQRLGLTPEDLRNFEMAFVEGMDSPRRSHTLGDFEESSPSEWKWGSRDAKKWVDLVLILFGETPDIQQKQDQIERDDYEDHGLSRVISLYSAPPARLDPTKKFAVEHFGFADGISQPGIQGSLAPGPDPIPAGEFILGYTNAYNKLTAIPTISGNSDAHKKLTKAQVRDKDKAEGSDENKWEFGHHGTYLVFRQLKQEVAKFRTFLRSAANTTNQTEDLIAAKIVGRWPSGALVKKDDKSDPKKPTYENFNFSKDDPYGYGCPLGSHIRRSNPRDVLVLGENPEDSLKVSRRHRILRRGRIYGPRLDDELYVDDDKDRGLLFLCINANIERQFEFVQHTWIDNEKFGSLYDEIDPLIGAVPQGKPTNMRIPAHPLRQRIQGIGRFVTVRGGAYFFLPSIKALRFLGELQP
ncbi:hypothetical protein MYX04_07850 [Nitrospiraceae bacterium AH_259_D15_M11_P09]|nr:hypothetical protein [Nitrospiraceae bacterium AH_259_D15_M11_P09]